VYGGLRLSTATQSKLALSLDHKLNTIEHDNGEALHVPHFHTSTYHVMSRPEVVDGPACALARSSSRRFLYDFRRPVRSSVFHDIVRYNNEYDRFWNRNFEQTGRSSSLYALFDWARFAVTLQQPQFCSWYGLYLATAQFTANLVICISLCRYYRSWLPYLLVPIYIIAVAAPNLNQLQFTVTSAITATAGGVLLMSAFQRKDPDDFTKNALSNGRLYKVITSAAGIALLLFSSFIRRDGLLLAITIFSFFIASKFGIRKEPKVLFSIFSILFATVIIAWVPGKRMTFIR